MTTKDYDLSEKEDEKEEEEDSESSFSNSFEEIQLKVPVKYTLHVINEISEDSKNCSFRTVKVPSQSQILLE